MLEDIPTEYLEWLLSIELKPQLRHGVEKELRQREENGQEGSACDAEEIGSIVQKWYRALALKYHPDRGGAHEAMLAVREANELLISMLREKRLLR